VSKLKVIIYLFIMPAIAACVCCAEETPCQADSFFCSGTTVDWEQRASTLPTQRVLELHVINERVFRPSIDVFIRVLGHRGEETIITLLHYLEEHSDKREYRFYEPILFEVVFVSRFNFCESQYYPNLVHLLSLEERRKLQSFCESDLSRPRAN
jgi:hypothetical protein